MNTSELASTIDHTLLTPEATHDEVSEFCRDALHLGVAAICVTSAMVPTAIHALQGAVPVAAVVGFPSGAHSSAIKAAEAQAVIVQGAVEIDMVADLGAIAAGDWKRVRTDIEAVRRAVPDAHLKVIVESALWDRDRLEAVVREAVAAGADHVKTSTGFHPAGGATLDAVRTMAEAAGDRVDVKASGGIRDRAVAEAMLEAGATRLGCSRTRQILGLK